jgi:hypothetical protein
MLSFQIIMEHYDLFKTKFKSSKHKMAYSFTIILTIFCIVMNISYSSMVIDYYNNSRIIDDKLYNWALAIIVINSFGLLCGSYWSS